MFDHNLQRYAAWAEAGLGGQPIDRSDALSILQGEGIDLLALLQAAGRVRHHYFQNTVSVHVLDNVRNGACPEDCGYCGQSKNSDAPIKAYKIKTVEEILADARAAKEQGAYRFCMALSGRGPNDRDIDHMCDAIRQVKAMGLRTCLSAGLLDEERAQRLKEAGLDRFNHNLNTSERHYTKICTTHTWQDRLQTIRNARAAGLGVCSGLIVGMGESYDDLLDVAFQLRDFHAESIPVNFLLPIEGNIVSQPECNGHPLSPQFVLRVLSMFRLVNPDAELRVAAGREVHLRSLQPLSMWPANSLFMDGYLLTRGQTASNTLQMLLDSGFTIRLDEGEWPEPLRRLAENGSATTTNAPVSDDSLNLKDTVARPKPAPVSG